MARLKLTHGMLALLVAATLGCVNLDKNKSPVPTKRSSKSFTSKLMSVLPKSTTVTAYGQKIAKDDPTSLAYKPGPIGADLYIAAARLSEGNGRVEQAIEQYRKALQADSRNRGAMIGLARLQHRNGDMESSILLYREALNLYRNDPVILNDLGLCYARSGQTDQAISVLRSATQAAPTRQMYRNNLAAALVEAKRPGEAVAHLTQTYGPAIANYNVGYLLNRSGQKQQAVQFLSRALEIDPSIQQARTMLDRVAPQVSSLPKSRQSGASGTATPTTVQDYPSHRWPAQDVSRPGAELPARSPAARPSHLQSAPQRYGPFGFVPVKEEYEAILASYEAEILAAPTPQLRSADPQSQPLRSPESPSAQSGTMVPPMPST